MKLKLTEKKTRYRVKLTDKTGYSEIFDSVKACAKAINVNPQTIYQAICDGHTVRGCEIEKII